MWLPQDLCLACTPPIPLQSLVSNPGVHEMIANRRKELPECMTLSWYNFCRARLVLKEVLALEFDRLEINV